MQFRFSFLLACFLATTFLYASNGPALIPHLNASSSSLLSCELPPPTDFHVSQQGPTSVTFEWVPISDAYQHRIKTYRASDGFLLDNTVVPAGIRKARIDIPNNTNVNVTINTICEDGSDAIEFLSLPVQGLIMDLIVAGFQEGQITRCSILNSGQCYFPLNGITPFKIIFGNRSRQFGVWYSYDDNLNQEHLIINTGVNGNVGQEFKLYCTLPSPNPPCFETPSIIIKHNLSGSEMTVASITLESGAGTGIFMCSLNQYYRIEQLEFGDANGGGSRDGGDGSESVPLDESGAHASPNPFSESLDVFPGTPNAESIHLQLFNLSGQKVLDQQFSGGQEQYSLPTAGLSSGFYMLRIEADGEVQTLKVVKSE